MPFVLFVAYPSTPVGEHQLESATVFGPRQRVACSTPAMALQAAVPHSRDVARYSLCDWICQSIALHAIPMSSQCSAAVTCAQTLARPE